MGFLIHPPSQATKVDKINGIMVTQPIQGQPIVIMGGQRRLPMGLLDYVDFTAKTVQQKTGGGGKGLGGSSTQTTTLYSATVLAALCQGFAGGVQGVVNVYDTKGVFQKTSVTENFTVPGGGGNYTVNNAGQYANDLGVGVATSYSQTVNDYGSPVSVTLSGSYQSRLSPVGGSPGAGQYSVNTSTGQYSFGSALGGQTVSISYTFNLLTVTETEIANIPSSPFQVAVNNNSIFQGNVSVVFYPSAAPLTQVGSSPGHAQYTVASNGTYTFAAADTGLAVLITYNINDKTAQNQNEPTTLSFTLFGGTTGQSPWSVMSSLHADRATGYTQLCYLGAQNMALGSGGELPNYTFELLGPLSYGAGIVDCNPKDWIHAIILDPIIGVGATGKMSYPSTAVGDLSQASNFWVANSFFISPLIQNQRTANDIIKEWIEAGMTAHVYSEGKSKFIPYGDTSAAGNGVIYIPNTQPVIDFSDDDFLKSKSSKSADPFKIGSVSIEEVFTRTQVQYANRLNNYNPEIVPEQNDAFQGRYINKPDPPVNWDFICRLDSATVAANMRLKRSVNVQIRDHEFSVSRRHAYLEPMDLITVTLRDSSGKAMAGFNKLPVRIQKIVDDPQKGLTITAEEFPWGTANPSIYQKQTSIPFYPNQGQAAPGSVNPPIIFEALSRLNQQLGYNIVFGLSGQSQNWGGCHILMSTDGTNWKNIGTFQNKSRMGVLTSTLASASDPDTTNTIAVDLTQSAGALLGGSQADCDALRLLCYVDGELISFETATLTAANKYNLGTRLRRGVFGSTISSHASGSSFLRLDGNVFEYTFDPTLIGTEVFFKFTSFNLLQQQEEQLANVATYGFNIQGVALGLLTPGHVSYRPLSNPLTATDSGLTVTDTFNRTALVQSIGATIGLSSSATNLIPDSLGTQLTWSAVAGILFDPLAGAVSGGAWTYKGTGAASGNLKPQSVMFVVQPSTTYTLSGYIDGSFVSSGSPAWQVYDPTVTTQYASATQSANTNGRITATFTTGANVSQVVVILNTNNCTVAVGQNLGFSDPQLEAGSSASAFVGTTATIAPINLVPDSNGTQATWTNSAGMTLSGGVWTYTGTGAASGFISGESLVFAIQPSTTYTFSVTVNATHVTAGSVIAELADPTVSFGLSGSGLAIVNGSTNGRVSATFTTPSSIPHGNLVLVLFDTDNCTVANGQPLTFSHPQLEAASLASAYSSTTANWGTLEGVMQIDSADVQSTGSECSAIYLPSNPFPSDQAASLTLTAFDTSGNDSIAVAVRMSSASGGNYYKLEAGRDGTGGGPLTLRKLVSGVQTLLAVDTGGPTPGISDTIQIQAIGSTINGLLNGVMRITLTDSSLGSGQPGIAGFKASGGTNALTRANNFQAFDATQATINIAAFSMRVPGMPDIPLNIGSLPGMTPGTLQFVYYDDPGFIGDANGPVTYHTSTTKELAILQAGRFFVGSIYVPQPGRPDTVGNNDGGVGAQSGETNIIPFTVIANASSGSTASVTNQNNIIDGDASTFATLSATGNGTVNNALLNISGASLPLNKILSVTLFVRYQITSLATTGLPAGGVSITANWPGLASPQTVVLKQQGQLTDASVKLATVINIPVNINLSLVTLTISASTTAGNASNSNSVNVYEAYLVTTQ